MQHSHSELFQKVKYHNLAAFLQRYPASSESCSQIASLANKQSTNGEKRIMAIVSKGMRKVPGQLPWGLLHC